MGQWEAARGASVEWYTPTYIFDALGCTFDLDVAHPPYRTSVPCKAAIYAGALDANWPAGSFVWMNPPFSGRGSLWPWVQRFLAHGNGIALTPDRTSADWFQAAWPRTELALFMPKVRFVRPDGSTGDQPANGTCLWAIGARGCAALRRAANVGIGVLAQPIGSRL